MTIILFSLANAVSQIIQNSLGDSLSTKVLTNHSQFANISPLVTWKFISNIFLSVLIFCITVRLLRPLSLCLRIYKFILALEKMRADLLYFTPLFVLIFSTVPMLYTLLLCKLLGSYRSFLSSAMTLSGCILRIIFFIYISFQFILYMSFYKRGTIPDNLAI